jgi:hypothetical protein
MTQKAVTQIPYINRFSFLSLSLSALSPVSSTNIHMALVEYNAKGKRKTKVVMKTYSGKEVELHFFVTWAPDAAQMHPTVGSLLRVTMPVPIKYEGSCPTQPV